MPPAPAASPLSRPVFDGKTLTLLNKDANLYAEAAVPGTIDQLIDTLRENYHRPLPGGRPAGGRRERCADAAGQRH